MQTEEESFTEEDLELIKERDQYPSAGGEHFLYDISIQKWSFLISIQTSLS